MTDITWMNTTVKLGDLKPWADNPRTSTKAQAKRILASFDRFGQVAPIAVGPNFEVYDGHQRLSALLTIHGPNFEVEARQSSKMLSDDERRGLVLALANATGSWSWDALANWNTETLTEWGFDKDTLKGWKSDVTALGEFLKSEAPTQDADPQTDRAAELLEKWGVQPGDLWLIGDHRLICGDCTDAATVARVMDGSKADMVFTDPPYNVAGNYDVYAKELRDSYQELKDAEWDQDFDVNSLFPVLDAVMSQDCSVYVCTSQQLINSIWEWAQTWADFSGYVVWCKGNPMPALSKRYWCWGTELIAYATKGRHVFNYPENGHALNWWNINTEQANRQHPTQKPVPVIEHALKHSSNEGQVIFDGFLGSGSTMVACENLRRRCRAIEISPAYVAVALERMATAFPALDIRRAE